VRPKPSSVNTTNLVKNVLNHGVTKVFIGDYFSNDMFSQPLVLFGVSLIHFNI